MDAVTPSFVLGEELVELSVHIDAAVHRFISKVREFDESLEWGRQGARTCAQWMSWRMGMDTRTSRDYLRVATALAKLPLIDDALRTGVVSYSKVRAMTRVATPANEATLLEEATLTTATQLETICRKYRWVQRADRPSRLDDSMRRYVTFRERDDGMIEMKALLHAEEAAVVKAAVDRVAQERCRSSQGVQPGNQGSSVDSSPGLHDIDRSVSTVDPGGLTTVAPNAPISSQSVASSNAKSVRSGDLKFVAPQTSGQRGIHTTTAASATTPPATGAHAAPPAGFDRASALVHIAEAVVRGDKVQRSATEVLVTIRQESLAASVPDPTHVGVLATGSCVSMDTVRRLCCDAGIVPVLENAEGQMVGMGTKARTISGSMKRALLQRDRTCTFPGCNARAFLEGHHIEHWADGGETTKENITMLCGFHHRFVHEYGYQIEKSATGPVFRTPDGKIASSARPELRSDKLGWPAILELNEDLAISADMVKCYDGSPVHYDLLIEHLVRADELDED